MVIDIQEYLAEIFNDTPVAVVDLGTNICFYFWVSNGDQMDREETDLLVCA